MGRPQTITDDEILAAARAVFLEKGILATVEEVAARCGVGEATVFRRFPTKQALFMAAMETAGEPEWARAIPERMDRVDVRENLLEVAHEMLAFARKRMPLLIMTMSNPMAGNRRGPPAFVRRALALLAQLMEAQADAGRLRLRDGRVAARILIGTIQHLALFEALAKPDDGITPEQVIEGLVELLCGPPVHRGKRT